MGVVKIEYILKMRLCSLTCYKYYRTNQLAGPPQGTGWSISDDFPLACHPRPSHGCSLGKYKPFGKKFSFLACKKEPILSVFTNTFLKYKSKNIYSFKYVSNHKSDLIGWLRYGVRIPKKF